MGPKEVIEAYYESIKDQWPGLTLEDVDHMCRAPFTFAKQAMQDSEMLPDIRFQFLGVLTVKLNKALGSYRNLEKNLADGKLSLEKYNILKVSLPQVVKRHKNYHKLKEKFSEEIQERADDTQECSSLLPGEPEAQALLQQEQTCKGTDEDTHQGTDSLQD